MLKKLIDQHYIDSQKHRDQTKFYVTDSGKCPRAVFFKFKNAPKKPIDARLMRIFEHGENIHRSIFNILYRMRIGVVTEISIPSQELVSGRADAILCMDKENYVLDIKSMNSMLFRKMKEPKEDNVYQLQLYMHFFDIKKGILLYVDKDQQDMKEYVVEYDKTLCKSLLDKFNALKKKIDSGEIPSRLKDYPKNWQCNYCVFKSSCKKVGAEDVSWDDVRKEIETV